MGLPPPHTPTRDLLSGSYAATGTPQVAQWLLFIGRRSAMGRWWPCESQQWESGWPLRQKTNKEVSNDLSPAVCVLQVSPKSVYGSLFTLRLPVPSGQGVLAVPLSLSLCCLVSRWATRNAAAVAEQETGGSSNKFTIECECGVWYFPLPQEPLLDNLGVATRSSRRKEEEISRPSTEYANE